MPQFDPPTPEREVLSFSVEGLSVREELLLKSFVRLLSHRTRHIWLYRAQPTDIQTDFKVDLRVVPDGIDALSIPPAQHVLTLGTLHRQRDAYVCLPLHADELEAALNRQGKLIVSLRAAFKPSPPPDPMVAHPRFSTNVLSPSHEAVRLVRWPPASLLGSAARMRLTTLMTGPPLTLAMLQQRSGLAAQVCAEFVDELRRAGYIHSPPATLPTARAPEKAGIAPKVQSGLLARIRSRLGLQASSHA
jgi:hypothetical protein